MNRYKEYRWRQHRGEPPRGAVMVGPTIWQVLEERMALVEGGHIEYTKWTPVPVTIGEEE